MTTEKHPTLDDCKTKHSNLWKVLGLIMTLMVGGLAAVGYTYVHADLRASEATKKAKASTDKTDMQIRRMEADAAVTFREVKVNAATAAVESRATRGRLEGMSARQERMEVKTDSILKVVLEIKRNGGGG